MAATTSSGDSQSATVNRRPLASTAIATRHLATLVTNVRRFARGDERFVAVGGEAWAGERSVAIRGGVSKNTVIKLMIDAGKARRELGWRPRWSSAEALAATRAALGW